MAASREAAERGEGAQYAAGTGVLAGVDDDPDAMESASHQGAPVEQPPTTIRYHYLKSSEFRVVHADGVFGGQTPKGYLQLAFFNERFPFPQLVEYELTTLNGDVAQVGPERSRVARDGLVREIEVSVVLDLDAAKALQSWLTDHIAKMEARNGGK